MSPTTYLFVELLIDDVVHIVDNVDVVVIVDIFDDVDIENVNDAAVLDIVDKVDIVDIADHVDIVVDNVDHVDNVGMIVVSSTLSLSGQRCFRLLNYFVDHYIPQTVHSTILQVLHKEPMSGCGGPNSFVIHGGRSSLSICLQPCCSMPFVAGSLSHSRCMSCRLPVLISSPEDGSLARPRRALLRARSQ